MKGNYRHGKRHTPEYSVWTGMLTRCRNQNELCFERYGGRGITVCERWLQFENFLADMGERPEGMTLERKDNDKGYEPDNCVWATVAEQSRNRRSNIMVKINGEAKCLTDWCMVYQINYFTARNRIISGWNPETAVTTPLLRPSRKPKR